MPSEERRKFPRLTLAMEDGYFGSFKLPDQQDLIAPILNLSAGGLNMAVSKEAEAKISEGDALMLKSLAGGTQLAFLSDIEAEIRWIREQNGQVYVGCNFNSLPEDVFQQLSRFVASERMARGQYD